MGVSRLNRLNELIHALCPDGVEYKKIKDVFQRLKGTPITAGKRRKLKHWMVKSEFLQVEKL